MTHQFYFGYVYEPGGSRTRFPILAPSILQRRWHRNERADLPKLATMFGDFLGMAPFAQDSSAFSLLVTQPIFDSVGPFPGDIEVLQKVMESVMVRHRWALVRSWLLRNIAHLWYLQDRGCGKRRSVTHPAQRDRTARHGSVRGYDLQCNASHDRRERSRFRKKGPSKSLQFQSCFQAYAIIFTGLLLPSIGMYRFLAARR